MKQANNIRNSANAYYVLTTISDDNIFENSEKFKLNWNLYKGDIPSDTTKGKFQL